MPPPDFTPEEEDRLHRLARLSSDPEHNGERTAERELRKPRFDGTINLGHVLTIVTMSVALATMWANGRVVQADHESRIKAIEKAQDEFKLTLAKLAETEAQGMRNQDKIAAALEWISKEKVKQ